MFKRFSLPSSGTKEKAKEEKLQQEMKSSHHHHHHEEEEEGFDLQKDAKFHEFSNTVRKEFQNIHESIDKINEVIHLQGKMIQNKDTESSMVDDFTSIGVPKPKSSNAFDENRIRKLIEERSSVSDNRVTAMAAEIKLLREQNELIVKQLQELKQGNPSVGIVNQAKTVFEAKEKEDIVQMKKDIQSIKAELSQIKASVQQLSKALESSSSTTTTSAFNAPSPKFPSLRKEIGGGKGPILEDSPGNSRASTSVGTPFKSPSDDNSSKSFNKASAFASVDTNRLSVTNPMREKAATKSSKDTPMDPTPLRAALPIVPPSTSGVGNTNDSIAKLQSQIIQASSGPGIQRIIQLSEKLNEIGPFTSLLRITVNVFKGFKCNKSSANDFILRLNHLCLVLCEFIELTYLDSKTISVLPAAPAATGSSFPPTGNTSKLTAVWSLENKDTSKSNNTSKDIPTLAGLPITAEKMQLIQENQQLIQIELQKSLIILKELLHKTQKYFIIFTKFGFFTERLLVGFESRERLRICDLEFTNEIINICSKFLKCGCFKDREYSYYIHKIDYCGQYSNFLCDLEAEYGPSSKIAHQKETGEGGRLGNVTPVVRKSSSLFDDPTSMVLYGSSTGAGHGGGGSNSNKYEPINLHDPILLEKLKLDLQMTQHDFLQEMEYYQLYIEKKSHTFYYTIVENDWNYYILPHPALKVFWKSRFLNQNNIEKLFFLTNLYDYLVKKENVNILYCEKLIKQFIPILDIINELYSPLLHHVGNSGVVEGGSAVVGTATASASAVSEVVIDYRVNLFKMSQFTKYFPHEYTLQQLVEQLLVQIYPSQLISLPSRSSSFPQRGLLTVGKELDSKLLLELSIEKVEKLLLAPSNGITLVLGGENIGKTTTLLHYLHTSYLPHLTQRNHFYTHINKLYHSFLWIDGNAFPLPSKVFTVNNNSNIHQNNINETAGVPASSSALLDQYQEELMFTFLQYFNDYFALGVLCTEYEWQQFRSSSPEIPLSQFPIYDEIRKFFVLLIAKQKKAVAKPAGGGSSKQPPAETKITIIFDNISAAHILFFSPLWMILSEFIEYFHLIFIISKPSIQLTNHSAVAAIDGENPQQPQQRQSSAKIIENIKGELMRWFASSSSSSTGTIATAANSPEYYRDYRYEEFIISHQNQHQEISLKIENYLLLLSNNNHHQESSVSPSEGNDPSTAEDPAGSTASYLTNYCKEICDIFQYHPILITMFSPLFTEEIVLQLVQDLVSYEPDQQPGHSVSHTSSGNTSPTTISDSHGFVTLKPFIENLKEMLLYYFLTIYDIIIIYSLLPLLYLPDDPELKEFPAMKSPSANEYDEEGKDLPATAASPRGESVIVTEELIYYLVKEFFPKSNETIVLFKDSLQRLTQLQIIKKITSSSSSTFNNPGVEAFFETPFAKSNSQSATLNGTGSSSGGGAKIGSYTEYSIDRRHLILISFYDYLTVQNRFHSQFAKQTQLVNKLMQQYHLLKTWMERPKRQLVIDLDNGDETNILFYHLYLKNYFEYIDRYYLYPLYKLLVYHGNYFFTTITTPAATSSATTNGAVFEELPANGAFSSLTMPIIPPPNSSGSSTTGTSTSLIPSEGYCLNDLILLLYVQRHRYHIHQYIRHFFQFINLLRVQPSSAVPSTGSSPIPQKLRRMSTNATLSAVSAPASAAASSSSILDPDWKHHINYFQEQTNLYFFTKSMEYLGKFFFSSNLSQKIYLHLFEFYFGREYLFDGFVEQLQEIVQQSSATGGVGGSGMKPIEMAMSHPAPSSSSEGNMRHATPLSPLPPASAVKELLFESKSWKRKPLHRYYLVFVLRNLADIYQSIALKQQSSPSAPTTAVVTITNRSRIGLSSEGRTTAGGIELLQSLSSSGSIAQMNDNNNTNLRMVTAAEVSELILLLLFHVIESPSFTIEMQECIVSSTSEPPEIELPNHHNSLLTALSNNDPLPDNPIGRRMSVMRQRQSVLSVPTPPKKETSLSASVSSTSVILTNVEMEIEKSKIYHVMSKFFLQFQKYSETILLYEKAMNTLRIMYSMHHNEYTEAVGVWLFGNASKKEDDLFSVYEISQKDEVPDTVSPMMSKKRDSNSNSQRKGSLKKKSPISTPTSSPTKTQQQRKSSGGKPPLVSTPTKASTSTPTKPSTTIPSLSLSPSPSTASQGITAPTIPASHVPNIHEFHQLVDMGVLFYNIASLHHLMKSHTQSIHHYSQALKLFQHCHEYLQWTNKTMKRVPSSSSNKIGRATTPSKSASSKDVIIIPLVVSAANRAESNPNNNNTNNNTNINTGNNNNNTNTNTIQQSYSDQYQHQMSLQSHYYSQQIITKIAKTMHCLSIVYYEQNQYSKSLHITQRLLPYYITLYGNEHYLLATLYHNIANLLFLTNQKKESIKFYEKSLKIYQKVSEQSLVVLAGNTKGLLMNEGILTNTHHEEDIANIFYNLGNIYKSLYLTKESIRNYEKAKNIYKQLLIHAQQMHLQNYSQLSQNHHQHPQHHHHHHHHHHLGQPPAQANQRPFTVQLPSNSSVASSTVLPPPKTITVAATRHHPSAILHYQNIVSEIQKQIDSFS